MTRLRALKPGEGRNGCDLQAFQRATRYPMRDVPPFDSRRWSAPSRQRRTVGPDPTHQRSLVPDRPKASHACLRSFSRCLSPLALPEESSAVSLGIVNTHIDTLTRYSDTHRS